MRRPQGCSRGQAATAHPSTSPRHPWRAGPVNSPSPERPDAAPVPPPREPLPPLRARSTWVRDLLEILLVAVVLYAVIWSCIETVRVDGDSMQNTLQNGDFLIASKISYVFGNPARGDIVILDPPHMCGETADDYIKRVVGLPGDNIEIDARSTPTELLVQPDGTGPWTRVEEPYLPNAWEQGPAFPGSGIADAVDQVLRIPAGDYFVMGDNRNQSCDSRFFGLVPRHRILAKAILRIWPLTSFGGLGAGPTLVAAPSPTVAPAAGSAGLLLLTPPFGARRRRLLARITRRRTAAPPGG